MNEYLRKLKIAVINKDIKKLSEFTDKIPEFENIEEAQEIVSYLNEAVKIIQREKNRLSEEMKKIKNLQKFNTSQKHETFSFKG